MIMNETYQWHSLPSDTNHSAFLSSNKSIECKLRMYILTAFVIAFIHHGVRLLNAPLQFHILHIGGSVYPNTCESWKGAASRSISRRRSHTRRPDHALQLILGIC